MASRLGDSEEIGGQGRQAVEDGPRDPGESGQSFLHRRKIATAQPASDEVSSLSSRF